MDDDLVQALYATSYRRLVGQLYGVCGDLTEAEDVVQEAFVRALRHRHTLATVSNPEAWLRRVAVNRARSRWRRRSLGEVLSRVRHDEQPHREPGADLDLSEDRICLIAAVSRLPARHREVIALHYLADLPVHEVAATLDVPVGSVKGWLSRGRAALAADPTLISGRSTARDHQPPATARSNGAPHA